MPKFNCVSRNQTGERVTAILEAGNRQELLTQLKDRGFTVMEIKELGERPQTAPKPSWKEQLFTRRGSVGTADLAIFWREFATMVNAGLPIVEALQSIAEELEHAYFRKVLQDVVSSLWEGFNFSESLSKHPKVFSPMVVGLIGAAEESGSLPQIANQLATYLENRDRIIRKVWAALAYPIFLSGFFLFTVVFATFWIIPKFREIYGGFHAKLPWFTEQVFAVNEFVLNHFIWIVIGICSVLLGFALWAKKPSGREFLDHLSLKLPIFGKLFQRAAIARFCRSLAILLAGGIPINRALEMAQETSGNRILSKAIRLSREEILKGGKIAATLKQHPIFPRMAVRMMAAGEETGNLTELLEKVADFYEARVDAALTTINALVEPIFIVVIGFFVLILILSLYLPIFSLGQAIR